MSETTHDSGQPVPEATVERWEPFNAFDWKGRALPHMEEVENGSWVRYEDYEKLLRWKQEQMAVTPDWQEIGREMGLTLGDSVHDKILPWIREMKRELNESRAVLDYMRGARVHGGSLCQSGKDEA